jgi:hypothetical protein
MVIIKFRNGSDWFKANWVFRQLADDTAAAFPDDGPLRLVLENAQALGGLFFDAMEPEVAISTMRALLKVADETIRGNIQGWKQTRPEDKDGQRMYFESISELFDLLRNELVGADQRAKRAREE